MRKDFVTTINNPQKITPPTYLSVNDVDVDGKKLLRIYVPESSQVHRCNGRIYDRNEDGDLDITDQTVQVAHLYQRKQATYSENKVYPYLGLDDLDRDLIAKCRKIASLRWDNHPWESLDDLQLLKSAQLYQCDPETGKYGITRAGILLLGKRSPLLSAVPHHRTDLILRKVNLDRYDDRDFVDVNLVESYERIMAFISKHLPDPFYLDGTTSISLRDAIFREIASNILIHREYTNAFPAKLIIERGQVRTENSNRPHGFGHLSLDAFTPFPKNPVIAGFFRQIGRADELGSGMRNMMRFGKAYGSRDPELIEGDIFRIVVKVPEFDVTKKDEGANGASVGKAESRAELGAESRAESGAGSVEIKLLALLKKGPLSKSEMANMLGLNTITGALNRLTKQLIERKLIEYTIPDKPTSRLQKYRLTAKGQQVSDNCR